MSFEIHLLTKYQCSAFCSYFPLVYAEVLTVWTLDQGKLAGLRIDLK